MEAAADDTRFLAGILKAIRDRASNDDDMEDDDTLAKWSQPRALSSDRILQSLRAWLPALSERVKFYSSDDGSSPRDHNGVSSVTAFTSKCAHFFLLLCCVLD